MSVSDLRLIIRHGKKTYTLLSISYLMLLVTHTHLIPLRVTVTLHSSYLSEYKAFTLRITVYLNYYNAVTTPHRSHESHTHNEYKLMKASHLILLMTRTYLIP